MSVHKPIHYPNGPEAKLTEHELDRVAGGYIGETEKNLKPARLASAR